MPQHDCHIRSLVVVVVVAVGVGVGVIVAVVVVVVVVVVKRHERFKHEGPRLHMAMLSAAVHLKAWIREEIESTLCEHPDELLIWADVYVAELWRDISCLSWCWKQNLFSLRWLFGDSWTLLSRITALSWLRR